jgi:hypothetical protein
MWATLLATGIITFFSACNTSNQVIVVNTADTVLLYKNDTAMVASTVPAVIQCQISLIAKAQYNVAGKIFLELDNPKILHNPNGVYELYISNEPPDIERLSSAQTAFVTVLDLYTLTAPGSKNQLEINISEHIKKLFLLKKDLLPLYISIRFGAIKLPDGTYSPKAGELLLSGISIIQIKP